MKECADTEKVTLLAEPSLTVHMLCTEKRLHESCQVLVEHAQRVAK